MKIAVIAANGRSGQEFVTAATKAGHTIHAGIRGNSKLAPNEHVTTLLCDATYPEQLEYLLRGQDAVVSFIGHVKGSAADVQTVAMQNIVQTMQKLGMKRIISLTGTGVRFSGDKITLIDRILNLGISIIDPKRVRDGKNHAEVLKNSDLDWTIVRVLKLQDVAPSPFSLKENGPTKPYVSRKDVALAVLEVLEQKSFVKQAPIISKA